MQMLLNGSYRENALMRILQLQSRFLRLDGPRLDKKNAGNNLQTVGDTMLHFLQQHVLFQQQLPKRPAKVEETLAIHSFYSSLLRHDCRSHRLHRRRNWWLMQYGEGPPLIASLYRG